MAMTPVPTALLQGASNFRDVGGYLNTQGRRVRRGQVFRSDHLAGLTDEDVARLQALGIGHSLDFRGAQECAATPYTIAGVQRVALTIEPTVIARMQALVAQGVVPTTDETVDFMRETYRDFVNHNAGTFGWFMKHLLEQPTPQVFHCTAGKDRTGFAAALVLSALGVDRATIEHDYLLTNQLYKRNSTGATTLSPDVLKIVWEVQESFLNAALDEIQTRHKGIQNYLRSQLGLTPAAQSKLQSLYLA
jgi:protein-tyrosine phosphatase